MRANNTYIVYDYETTSKNAYRTQPTQLAAVALDGRKLEIVGKFNSYIKISEDEEYMKKYNLDPISEEALQKTKISMETIRAAPEPKVVWPQFVDFVNQFNYRKNKWGAPVAAGFNIINYDNVITNRLCGAEPWKLGPFDEVYQTQSLFNPIQYVDLLHISYFWLESLPEPTSLSFDSLRQFFGMDTSKAHNAEFDVQQTAELLIRFLKLTRNVAGKTKFKGAMARNVG